MQFANKLVYIFLHISLAFFTTTITAFKVPSTDPLPNNQQQYGIPQSLPGKRGAAAAGIGAITFYEPQCASNGIQQLFPSNECVRIDGPGRRAGMYFMESGGGCLG